MITRSTQQPPRTMVSSVFGDSFDCRHTPAAFRLKQNSDGFVGLRLDHCRLAGCSHGCCFAFSFRGVAPQSLPSAGRTCAESAGLPLVQCAQLGNRFAQPDIVTPNRVPYPGKQRLLPRVGLVSVRKRRQQRCMFFLGKSSKQQLKLSKRVAMSAPSTSPTVTVLCRLSPAAPLY